MFAERIGHPAGTEDRLSQPLETKRQKQRADNQPERVDGNGTERPAEDEHEAQERGRRRTDTDEGRAPTSNDPDGEDDRERLDRLDCAREEGRAEEKGVCSQITITCSDCGTSAGRRDTHRLFERAQIP
jgi:hypothetical protein